MAAASDMTKTVSCQVDVAPREVEAGHDLTLTASVTSLPASDLRGTGLQIEDHHGDVVENIELADFDGTANQTGEFVVKAPCRPGEYAWRVVYPAPIDGDGDAESPSATFSFVVKPHATRVVVWDVPPTVEGRERFRVRLGVTCSSDCPTSGWSVGVHDHDGTPQATATLSEAPWTGTGALYFTQLELTAPAAEGLYAWEARVPAQDVEVPHTEGIAGFGVRVVPCPECRLTVVAVDAADQTPVAGAKVVVHPYRGVTDRQGAAEIRIPRGGYRLFVSGRGYRPFRRDGQLTSDATIKAELAPDRGLSDADIWS